MKYPVKCKNCGIKWLRVIEFGDLEMTVDIQHNCPACGSNWFEGIEETCTESELKEGE
jgi:predicted Zn-ribbon and HTH transcriptional regulator